LEAYREQGEYLGNDNRYPEKRPTKSDEDIDEERKGRGSVEDDK